MARARPPRQSIINPQPIIDDPNILLDFNTLQGRLSGYIGKLDSLKNERNYIQMDRDMIENFYRNSQDEIEEMKTKIRNSDSKIEEMENNHQIDVKVFIQKMKHLEFEKDHNNRLIEYNGENAHNRENEWFYQRIEELKKKRNIHKREYNDNDKMYIDKVVKEEELQKKIFASKQREFDESVNELIRRYEDKLEKLKNELELKLKAEIHELEERKNQHINELINKHEKSFAELKKYYNEITAENLNLIKALNDEIGRINSNLNINTKLVSDMKEEIKALNIPLENKTKEKNELLQLLRGFEKDKMSMSNLKSKLIVLREKIIKLETEKKDLDDKFYFVETEKRGLEDNFDKIAKEVRKHAELNNTVLRERLLHLEDEVQHKELEVEALIEKFGENAENTFGLTGIKESINSKNLIIKNLKYSIHHATKAYNDAIRVYEAKLVEFGIPPEELGFQLLETITSTMPAGLVAS